MPGILRPPHVPEILLQGHDYWYCSDGCFEASQPSRDEHQARVHAACSEKPHVPGSVLDAELHRKAELRIEIIKRVRPNLRLREIENLAVQLMDTPDSDIQIVIENSWLG